MTSEAKSQTHRSKRPNKDPKARDILTFFFLAPKELHPLGTQPQVSMPMWKLIFVHNDVSHRLQGDIHTFLFICSTQKKLAPKQMKAKAKWVLLQVGMERASSEKLFVDAT